MSLIDSFLQQPPPAGIDHHFHRPVTQLHNPPLLPLLFPPSQHQLQSPQRPLFWPLLRFICPLCRIGHVFDLRRSWGEFRQPWPRARDGLPADTPTSHDRWRFLLPLMTPDDWSGFSPPPWASDDGGGFVLDVGYVHHSPYPRTDVLKKLTRVKRNFNHDLYIKINCS